MYAAVVVSSQIQANHYDSYYWTNLNSELPDRIYRCNGQNDWEMINRAVQKAGTGRILITGGLVTPNLSSGSITLSGDLQFEIDSGAKLQFTGGTTADVYLFCADGSTAGIGNVFITGAGEVVGSGTRNGLLHVKGDVKNVRVRDVRIRHNDATLSGTKPIFLEGNAGQGIRDVVIDPIIENWGNGSAGERLGAVMISGNVRRVNVDGHLLRNTYGVTAFYEDVSPIAVLWWDNSAGTYATFAGSGSLFDTSTLGAAGTNGTLVLDANDALDICFAQQVQAMRVWIGSAGNTNNRNWSEFSTYNGTVFTRQAVIWDDTGTAAGGGTASRTLERTGNMYWGEPRESEFSTGTLLGTSGFWVRLRPVNDNTTGTMAWYGGTGTGSGTALSAISLTEIMGFVVPRQIRVGGFIEDTRFAGVHMRGAMGVKSEPMTRRTATHAANYNSHDSVVLTDGGTVDDRYMPTMFFHDTGLYIESQDTQVLTRAAAFGRIDGMYVATEPSVTYEQGDSGNGATNDVHLTKFTWFNGMAVLSGRMGMRAQGHDNLLDGFTIMPARYRELAGGSDDKSGINIEGHNMTDAARNLIRMVIRDAPTNGKMRQAILVESDATGTNWVSQAAFMDKGFNSMIDDGGTSIRYLGSAGTGLLVQYGTFSLPVDASSTGTINHNLSTAPSWSMMQVVGNTTFFARVLSADGTKITARVESVAGTGAGSGTYTVMVRMEV